ncbi:ATP-binding protein [Terrisporobacter sp.]
MSLLKYLREIKLYLILIIFILLIMDITIFLDINLSKSFGTLVYINILVILTTIIFTIIGYGKYKRKINEFIHQIHNSREKNGYLEENYLYKEIKAILEENEQEVCSLRSELEEIDDYMTNWIHEVKIPISVLQMIGKRINEIDTSRELSKQINSEISRIDKLVEQAMYSSRAGNYNSDFLINEVNLEQVVKEVIRKNKYQFIYNKIDLQVGEIKKIVLTDKKWITHIVELILDNAIKYSDIGGKIDIYLKENKKGCELHIKDYGMGIVPQDIGRIFDKGFTGENGRKRTKSTGMGLYISKKILNKLSHNINAISTANEFCDVYITFYNLSDYFNVT